MKAITRRIIKECIQRYSFSIHTNVSMRTYSIEKTRNGDEYFVFRGDEHHIFVRQSDGSWTVIDDNAFLHSQLRQSKKDSGLWSHLAALSLKLTKYPYPSENTGRSEGPREDAGRSEGPKEDSRRSEGPKEDSGRSEGPREDAGRSEGPSEPLPMVDSIRSVSIPTLRAFFSIKQMYPQYFANDQLSQCQECGTVFLPSEHCPYGHDHAESPEIVRLARCLLTQFELGIAFAHMSKKSQEEWTPARRLMWLKQGRKAV